VKSQVSPANVPATHGRVLGMYDSQPGSRTRPAHRGIRVAAGLAAAALLVGGGAVLGAHLTAAGSRATVTTRLASSETLTGVNTSALGISLLGSQAVTSAVSGQAGKLNLKGLRACLAQARRLARNGHRQAARAKLRACLREYHAGGLILVLRLFRLGGEYGQVTFKTKSGTAVVAFERGVVQSVSGQTAAVKAADGTTWTWDLISKTVVVSVGAGKGVHAGKLAQGQRVFVVGTVVGGTDDARLFVIRG
jgi:hypothetical protein